MAGLVNMNGEICGEQEAVVSVFDHGFLYGEGVYEVLRTYHGRLFHFDRHMRRLRRSAEMIALTVPVSDPEMEQRALQTIETVRAQTEVAGELYVRIMVTRGAGELNYDPRLCPQPSVIIIARPFLPPSPSVYEQGVKVVLASVIRNHPGSINPLIKSNNLLNNALAMQEAYRRGAFEAVMRNHRGELAECSQSNLFVVKAQTVLTPPLDAGLLAGITRELVFEAGFDAGVVVRETVLHDQDLLSADEAFLTSTTRDLVPIVRVDDRTIGNGRPGPITLRLLDGYHRSALNRSRS
ncbi:MAG: aminotransferase class IV [Acidobacteria bacterium]|nr:aminotransferase class IV [Acidobacteriota bacterium]